MCVRVHGCERRERVWADKEHKICPTYINVCSSQVKANDSCILLFLLLSLSLTLPLSLSLSSLSFSLSLTLHSPLSLVAAAVLENFN